MYFGRFCLVTSEAGKKAQKSNGMQQKVNKFLKAYLLKAVPYEFGIRPNEGTTVLQKFSMMYELDYSWTTRNGIQQMATMSQKKN